MEHHESMKARNGWFQLGGLILLAVGAMLCASAVAGPKVVREPVVAQQRIVKARPVPKRVIYVQSSASAVPIPIDWVTGIPTTAVPMTIIGRGEAGGR